MERNYTITLKNETDDGGDSPIAGEKKPKKDPKGNAAAKSILKGLVAYNGYVKPFVSQALGHQINTITLRTGAEEQQQRVQFAYQIAESVVGIGASILTGFAIGNVAGAVVGAVVGVTTTALNYVNKAQEIEWQSQLEGISLRGLNVRAGGFIPSYSGSRNKNQ